MKSDEVRTSVRRSWRLADAIGLMLDVSNEMPLAASPEFIGMALDKEVLYEDLYLCGLRNKDYNFSLHDFSYFQFGISKDHHVRYAFYPNPFIGSEPEKVRELNVFFDLLQEGEISFEDYLAQVAVLRSARHAPLVRYENSPDDYVQWKHPTSHFHLGNHSDNRWPIGRCLTPFAFSLFILKQFYPAIWFENETLVFDGASKSLDQRLCEEKQNCRVLSSELLTDDERLQFVFQ